MLQTLSWVLVGYTLLCYALGSYLAVRLFTGRRARRTFTSERHRPVRPLHAAPPASATPATPTITPEPHRAAA